MRRYVLDSFALITYLQDEPGRAQVEAIFERALQGRAEVLLSIINYGEVVYITAREQGRVRAQATIAGIDQLPIMVVDADRALTFAAAHIKARKAISYADAFAVALAVRQDATLLTGDPEMRAVENEAEIEWLPRQRR